MSVSPFLVVGCARSGTSLLRAMLDSHPGAFLPAETFFFVSIVPRTSLDPATQTREVADFIASRWWVREMQVGARAILDEVDADAPDWFDLFRALVRAAARVAGRPDARLGEKTPRHVTIAQEYLEAEPTAQVIQIVRDPRAVLASFRGVPIGTRSAALVGDEWSRAIDVHRALARHPRYHMLRYEDLVERPAEVLEAVLGFLRLSMHDDVLAFDRRERKGFSERQPHHRTTLQPLTSGRVDAWHHELSSGAIRVVETVVGPRIRELEYPVTFPGRGASSVRVATSRLAGLLHRHTVLRVRQWRKRRS